MTNANWTNSSSHRSEDDPRANGVFWFFGSLFCIGLVADCLIIIIINKTPTLKSYTGYLMTSQILSDIGLYIVSFLMILPRLLNKTDIFGEIGRTILANLARAFHGITSQTLAAISLNLYFAICHSASYRKRMSVRHVRIFIPVCWIFNILLCMIPLVPDVTRESMHVLRGVVILPNYVPQTLWAWVIIVVNAYVISAIVSGFVFLKIRMYSQKIQAIPIANLQYRDKYLLSQVVAGISVCYIGMWSLLHLFRALQAKYEVNNEERGIFQNLTLVAYLVNLAYDTFKLGVYAWTYRPIWDTVVQVFRSRTITPSHAVVVQNASNTV